MMSARSRTNVPIMKMCILAGMSLTFGRAMAISVARQSYHWSERTDYLHMLNAVTSKTHSIPTSIAVLRSSRCREDFL